MRLDVGCGNRPTGDVNVDLYFNEKTLHLDSLVLPKLVKSENTKNSVKADAQYLPFKDGSFDEVYSNHVLEHLNNPSRALKEIIRVSKLKITFVVPHRMNFVQRKRKHLEIGVHKHVFTVSFVRKWLKGLGLSNFIVETNFRPFPSKFFQIFRIVQLPKEIEVEIWK